MRELSESFANEEPFARQPGVQLIGNSAVIDASILPQPWNATSVGHPHGIHPSPSAVWAPQGCSLAGERCPEPGEGILGKNMWDMG